MYIVSAPEKGLFIDFCRRRVYNFIYSKVPEGSAVRENQNIDKRIIKTKKAIRYAFGKLLTEKSLDEITVKDISETADINRKTFYNYYSGVYEVVNEIEAEIAAAFDKALENIDFRTAVKCPDIVFEKLNALINEDLEFYGYLLSRKSNSTLTQKLTVIIADKIKNTVQSQFGLDTRQVNVSADFIVSGMISVYREWFNGRYEIPIEEVSRLISILALSGFNGVLAEKYAL